jgi:CBS domain containing-hemolysin-like protein
MTASDDGKPRQDASAADDAPQWQADPAPNGSNGGYLHGLRTKLRHLFGLRNGDSALRESIETILEESERHGGGEDDHPISDHERVMLLNILKLRHLTAYDVMVPRADIEAVEVSSSLDEVLKLMSEKGHSRLPVYRETLDEVIGFVHMKDVLASQRKRKRLSGIVRDVLIVAPSMRVLDLLLDMRLSRVHMAMVVDEYGGIDGLVTIEDLVEEIVGEIEDEHDVASAPRMIRSPDGYLVVDARMDIEEFESRAGPILTEEEREEDIDTLGGLVVSLAGHVPGRGELVTHPSGISFEVIDADPRRIKRLRVRNVTLRPAPEPAHGK